MAETEGKHTGMRFLLDIKWSLVAFVVTLVLGFLSMGALGAALYYACYPLLSPFYGNLDDWRGDWVWPATIVTGMLWAVSFPVAGALDRHLAPRVPAAPRMLIYLAVLWLGAALVWAFTLASSYEPPAAEKRAELVGCGKANRGVIEAGLSRVLKSAPALLDEARCLKTPFGSDMVAMVELAPGSDLEGMAFHPGSDLTEAPLNMLETIFPETFEGLARTDFEVASTFDSGHRNIAVHLIRLRNGKLYALVNDVM